ncbi:hypothetical protein Tco_1067708 [Tanacetum coccineum]|uniref:Uncharacterized protein n=1 Tax=Tanacetum coccineum TaxID=301880 RepID=A0ABQ5HF22_9ASTR
MPDCRLTCLHQDCLQSALLMLDWRSYGCLACVRVASFDRERRNYAGHGKYLGEIGGFKRPNGLKVLLGRWGYRSREKEFIECSSIYVDGESVSLALQCINADTDQHSVDQGQLTLVRRPDVWREVKKRVITDAMCTSAILPSASRQHIRPNINVRRCLEPDDMAKEHIDRVDGVLSTYELAPSNISNREGLHEHILPAAELQNIYTTRDVHRLYMTNRSGVPAIKNRPSNSTCNKGAKGFYAVAFFILESQLGPFMRLVCYKNIDSIYFCPYEKRMEGEDIYMYRNDQVGKRFAFGIADHRISRFRELEWIAESLVLLLSSPADRELEIIEQLMNIQSDEGRLENRLSLSQVLIQGFEVILPGKATMEHTIIPSTKGKSRKDIERGQNFLRIAIQIVVALPEMEQLSTIKQEDMVGVNLRSAANTNQSFASGVDCFINEVDEASFMLSHFHHMYGLEFAFEYSST